MIATQFYVYSCLRGHYCCTFVAQILLNGARWILLEQEVTLSPKCSEIRCTGVHHSCDMCWVEVLVFYIANIFDGDVQILLKPRIVVGCLLDATDGMRVDTSCSG